MWEGQSPVRRRLHVGRLRRRRALTHPLRLRARSTCETRTATRRCWRCCWFPTSRCTTPGACPSRRAISAPADPECAWTRPQGKVAVLCSRSAERLAHRGRAGDAGPQPQHRVPLRRVDALQPGARAHPTLHHLRAAAPSLAWRRRGTSRRGHRSPAALSPTALRRSPLTPPTKQHLPALPRPAGSSPPPSPRAAAATRCCARCCWAWCDCCCSDGSQPVAPCTGWRCTSACSRSSTDCRCSPFYCRRPRCTRRSRSR